MSIDKKKIGKILKVTAIGTGAIFWGLNMIAKKKKGIPFLKKKKIRKILLLGKSCFCRR